MIRSWIIAVSVFACIGTALGAEEPVFFWQSYCGSEPGRIHRWNDNSGSSPTVERVTSPNEQIRSAIGFTRAGKLTIRDVARGSEYALGPKGFAAAMEGLCPPFEAMGFTFSQQNDVVTACRSAGCIAVDIKQGTWPYAFAYSGERVLAATNYGSILIFDGSNWCHADKVGDQYQCGSNVLPTLDEPRGVQFYSSVVYKGHTLVGEWPTGRIYEFDGSTLRPATSIPQPPFVTGEPVGYEAQSMASYCGDLYVGYWPRGEVWRFDGGRNQWFLVKRLFTHPADPETFIPYAGEEPEGLPSSFFGQRVTSLTPYGDSLYATTSNLREWAPSYNPDFLTPEQISEYGAVYRIHEPGCETLTKAQ